jgi:hypothetical protein
MRAVIRARARVFAVVVVLAMAWVPRAAAAAPAQSLLHRVGTVDASSLPSHGARSTAGVVKQPPAHPHRRPSGGSASPAARTSSPTAIAIPDSGASGARTLAGPTALEQLQDFGGDSAAEQSGDFPNQSVTPPDTQIAVGALGVAETTNSAMLVSGRHGENRHLSDLYLFWGNAVPTGYSITDSRIVYDPAVGRFYLSSLFFGLPSQASVIGLAISANSDPARQWTTWTFTSAAHTLDDQPLLGFDDNDIVLSWNAFDNNAPASCGNPNDAQMLIVDKHDVDNGALSPATHLSAQFAGVESLVPAISESSTSTEYVLYNKEDLNCNNSATYLSWSQVGMLPITGEPDASGSDTTSVGAETDLTLRDAQNNVLTVFAPPFATQPNNGHYLDDADGRMQGVVFTNGLLYTSGAVAYPPTNAALSALFIERVDVAVPSIENAVLFSQADNLFDPAVAVDGNGVAFYSFTRSGTQTYATSGAGAYDWNTGGLYSTHAIGTGVGGGVYACGAPSCQLFATANGDPIDVERWGDYSGIAVDPVDPNDVWVASEFAPSNGSNWGTSISRTTIAQPTVTSIDVGSGRTNGGTTLTVTGTEFDPVGTSVQFGGVAAEVVNWVDPEHVVVVSPPHPAGVAGVSVSTADGLSAAGAWFTYVLPPVRQGYWMVASDGGIFSFGTAAFHGSTGMKHLNQPIVGMAATPSGNGYWLVASDGGIFSFGDAQFHGSTGAIRLNKPIVGMAATPSGNGYWLVASDGGIFSFGDAQFHGSTGAIRLNQPIVGMAAMPSGNGYWLVASDGGIFSFGDAAFHGSAGNIHLNKPIVGMSATSDGGGYWLVATDGGIFTYGDAVFHGSAGALPLNQPIVGMAESGDDGGYWLVARDGGIFSYGDASFHGSTGALVLNQPVVGMASVPA